MPTDTITTIAKPNGIRGILLFRPQALLRPQGAIDTLVCGQLAPSLVVLPLRIVNASSVIRSILAELTRKEIANADGEGGPIKAGMGRQGL